MHQSLGLTSAEAKKLQIEFGLNQIAQKKKFSALTQFLLTFNNPLTIVLIGIVIISALLGEWLNATIIFIVVLVSVSLDFFNTYKSERAAEALQNQVKTTVTILRDGSPQEFSMEQIVPGDSVILNPGTIIPADGVIQECNTLFLDESSLTGEAFPVEKTTNSEVYMGSSVVSGTGMLIVQQTGARTKFSHIAETLLTHTETDFDRGMREFSSLILKGVIGLGIFVFTINFALKGDIFQSLLFAVAIAVGLTPELLPMIITLNLTKGALGMSKHGVIVKKITSIQNFGSMDVLCTDKTGTITENKISLVKCVDGAGNDNEKVFLYSYLNYSFESGISNALDQAVKNFKSTDISGYQKISEIPFDFKSRRSSIVVKKDSKTLLITKGAVEEVLLASTFYGDNKTKITKNLKFTLHQTYEQLSQDGFRVLAVATKQLHTRNETENNLTFLGFLAFLDPAKKSSQKTLKTMQEYGIAIKILTGDNELVTQRIAAEIKLPILGTLIGEEVALLTDSELSEKVETTTIFARLTPDLKLRIIASLRANGHVVGYMGDGINDAPALRQADVAISVNNAVDVAKETADIILLDKSLKQLVNGVIEGRKTFINTQKYLTMDFSSNVGNMFSMVGASIVLPFLPLLPTQVLLNNLIYDTSQLAIPFDNVDEAEIKLPRKWDLGFLKKFILVFGPVSSLFDFLSFGIFYFVLHFNESTFQTAWFLQSITTQIFVVYIIRTKRTNFLASKPSLALVTGSLIAGLFSWGVALSPVGALLGFTPISFGQSLVVAWVIILYLLTVNFVKGIFYHTIAQQK